MVSKVAANVNFLLGDSGDSKCLESILEKCHHSTSSTRTVHSLPAFGREKDVPIAFFLDSHYSSGETGRGTCDVPLLLELRVLAAARRPHADVVVIDDHRLFGTKAYRIRARLAMLMCMLLAQDAEDWGDITEETVLACFKEGHVNRAEAAKDRFVIYLNPISR